MRACDTPIARSTCDGSSEPEEQADPVDTAIPSRSSAIRSDFGLDPLEADVARIRHAARRVAVHYRPGHGGEDGLFETIAKGARRRGRSLPGVRARSWRRRPCPASAGTFSVPARRLRSCRPPVMNGVSLTPRRIHSAPVPFGPPNLWPDSDSRSTPRLSNRHGNLADRLDRVGMEEGAVRAGDGGELRDRLNRAHLVVGVHHRHEDGVRPEGGAQVLSGESTPDSPTGSSVNDPAPPGERLQRVQHGFVFDGGRDEMAAAGRLQLPPRRRAARSCRPRCRRW